MRILFLSLFVGTFGRFDRNAAAVGSANRLLDDISSPETRLYRRRRSSSGSGSGKSRSGSGSGKSGSGSGRSGSGSGSANSGSGSGKSGSGSAHSGSGRPVNSPKPNSPKPIVTTRPPTTAAPTTTPFTTAPIRCNFQERMDEYCANISLEMINNGNHGQTCTEAFQSGHMVARYGLGTDGETIAWRCYSKTKDTAVERACVTNRLVPTNAGCSDPDKTGPVCLFGNRMQMVIDRIIDTPDGCIDTTVAPTTAARTTEAPVEIIPTERVTEMPPTHAPTHRPTHPPTHPHRPSTEGTEAPIHHRPESGGHDHGHHGGECNECGRNVNLNFAPINTNMQNFVDVETEIETNINVNADSNDEPEHNHHHHPQDFSELLEQLKERFDQLEDHKPEPMPTQMEPMHA